MLSRPTLSRPTRSARGPQTLLAAATLLVLAATAGAAQSLGDVALQEQARRQGVKAAGKVYTNNQLKPETRPPAASVPPSAASPPAAASSDGSTVAGPAAPAAPPRDEKYWRDRLKTMRETIGRSRLFADALQSRINGLDADFTARDDPFQRDKIAKDRDTAVAELERVRGEITQQAKALADAEEEARRSGVPAGWLRE